jgi:hypothetical protein
VPRPSCPEVETAIANFKIKSPRNGQVPAELIQVGCETLLPVIHKFINSFWNEEDLHDEWQDSIIVPIHKKGFKTDCNNYHCYQLHSKFLRTFFCQG